MISNEMEVIITSLQAEGEAPFKPAIAQGSVYYQGKDFFFASNTEKQLTYLMDKHKKEFAFSSLQPSFVNS
jgi:hypothetical protein